MSPINSPVVGLTGTCPEINNKFPDLMAWEYGPIALGAFSVKITFLDNYALLSKIIFQLTI
jgi:hypothetical protein